jgi:hypothetical protein
LRDFVNVETNKTPVFNIMQLATGLHSREPISVRGLKLLRIHKKANGDVVFTLSGRIDKEHIAELEALIGAEGKARPISLDLKDMTLTGQDGINFLAQCEAADIALVNCDPYVREWITRQKPERSADLDPRKTQNKISPFIKE